LSNSSNKIYDYPLSKEFTLLIEEMFKIYS
jgi:hypothetical protein